MDSIKDVLAVVALAIGSSAAWGQTCPPQPAGTMDVTGIVIEVDVSRTNGNLDDHPYLLSVNVEGSNITAGQVHTPNQPSGGTHSLTLTEDGWSWTSPVYNSLIEMRNSIELGFGDFVFTFSNGSSTDTVVLPYDPGAGYSGYAAITYPTHNQLDVVLAPTIAWTCQSPPCANYAWFANLYDDVTRGVGYEDALWDTNATSWTPGPLTASTFYQLSMNAASLLESPQALSTSAHNDCFLYYSAFKTQNRIDFTTQPSTQPGRVLDSLQLQPASSHTQLVLSWSKGTCGGQDYGLFRGTIGSWYSHVGVVCTDVVPKFSETLPMPAGNVYFLVVPLTAGSEGSYGLNSSGAERPRASSGTCRPVQSVNCP